MNLLLDIGNARIKWALGDLEQFRVEEPMPHDGKPFKDLARPCWKELEAPDRVIVSNVRGSDYEKSVQTWVRRRWKVTPEFLRSEAQCCGVSNAYSQPDRLGVDRWASLFAIHANYSGPSVVVDCGTAITIDAIDGDGRHQGGLIVPGMELMKTALAEHAPGIQLAETAVEESSLLAQSTEAAVSGGILYTATSLIDRVFMDLNAELGSRANLIITGGDALRVRPLLSQQPSYDPHLVLEGLAVYAAKHPCDTS